MIEAVREWLTSIVVVTLLLSVVQTLVPEGTFRKISSFTGGLILVTALIQPVLKTDLDRLRLDFDVYEAAIEERQEELAADGKAELTELIEARTAAYISDKAAALGLDAAVRVKTEQEADGTPIPTAAEVTGPYSELLAVWIEEELGIPRERQVWHEREN